MLDVARAAGVGKTTVSLALRDHPKITLATRQRVKAVAEKLGYRPDPALAQIAAHRWRTREHPSDFVLAFITTPHPWAHNETVPELRVAAMEHGTRLGYHVEHFRQEDYPGPKPLARVLFHRGIRGVIVGQILDERFVQEFPWESFTSVGCHVGYVRPPVNVVIPDFHHGVARAWSEAVAAGYRRIGVALLQEMQAVDLFDKVSAALFCQSRQTPEVAQIPVRHFPMDDQQEFQKWLEEYQPDVVLGWNVTVCSWLARCGRQVPRDIAFVSLDNFPSTVFNDCQVTGLNPDYALIGHTAVEQLDLLLRANRSGIPTRPLTVHVPSEWIPGETLPAAAGRRRPRARPPAPGEPLAPHRAVE
jgi:LacI family transcriptional regulator